MIGLLLLVGLGLGLYFFVFAKKDCKKITEEDECTEPCQWDTYGDKCIGEKDTLTAAPTPTPPGCSTYTTQDTCVSPCEWDSSTSKCGSPIMPSGGGQTMSGYTKFGGKKLKSETRISSCVKNDLEQCKTQCMYNENCIAFTHNGERCCLYNGISNFSDDDKTDLYLRNADGYENKSLGNFTGDDILTTPAANLELCGRACDEAAQCKGFSYKIGSCVLKGANLSSTPVLDGSQYYKRSSSNIPGEVNCKSLAAVNLANKKVFIATNDSHEVPNKSIAARSHWHGDQWKDQGQIYVKNYVRTFGENSGQVATIAPVPGRTDEYFITFTYTKDAREGPGVRTIMMFGGGANDDNEVTWFGSWTFWNDPICRWKFFKKEGTDNEYWIVTNREHRAPCMMLKMTSDGLRAIPFDTDDTEAVWVVDEFTPIG